MEKGSVFPKSHHTTGFEEPGSVHALKNNLFPPLIRRNCC